ncbi:MAG: hypothetical protein A2381_02900 [Bdellovibrionales bacterium RIFOXYB1_FULL_37_110]|nr:MAG: hypothetical protein A2181_03280 [Bdellovibrionales bacterium RIFOXYA1_FULL_38_20]OFZ51454.1 MAG: hypothetical protein A2417_09355 [Bdellovibrionales bacterium RIFOXYC1_FULL_37_79]OFZ57882.1 MAG: hypothetical protein A2381_02900 [Bdellovibrionales bacterium RIFOXYB1_FULL_37_110]OFZ63608.1 MAG: hypothetical protein A2577_05200 [Bdellovibrionales bacterium RIFOXYD1_FULL_36_51]
MNLVFYADTIEEINDLYYQGILEVILSPKNLASFGTQDFAQIQECLCFSKEIGVTAVIEWDILMTEESFSRCAFEVLKYYDEGANIFRVRDTGAIYFIKEKTKAHIDLIQGHFNQNMDAILFWQSYLTNRLRKLVVSQEATFEFIKKIKTHTCLELEVMLLGKILMSYTPRRLLTKYSGNNQGITEVYPLEGPAEKFEALQNNHGTFLFYSKDFSLFDSVQELIDINLDAFRVDLRFSKDATVYADIIKYLHTLDLAVLEQVKTKYKHDLTNGFYPSNSSDKIFQKLKNEHLKITSGKFVGEVIDVKKDEFVGVLLKGEHAIDKKSRLYIITPDGRKKNPKLSFLKNTSWQEIDHSDHECIVYFNYVGGVTFKSLVFVKD